MTREAILRGAVVDLIDDAEDLEAKVERVALDFADRAARLRHDAHKTDLIWPGSRTAERMEAASIAWNMAANMLATVLGINLGRGGGASA